MIDVSADGMEAQVAGLTLRPHAAFDTVAGLDETIEVLPPRVDGDRIELERRSTIWERALTTITCTDRQVELRFEVRGRGELTDVNLLALRSLLPKRPNGLLPSGYPVGQLTRLFCPNPAHSTGVRPIFEPAVIGVVGDGEPGRHHWFFTPAPLYFAFAGDDEDEWIDLGLAAPVEQLTFVEAAYAPRDGGFHLRLEYEGHTDVDGEFATPALVLTPHVPDPYTGLRRHRDDLTVRGSAPPVEKRERPSWWSGPIFSGWGAQCHLADSSGVGIAADYSTQQNYDAFLDHLEAEDVVPGTIVLDDKWQAGYGINEPDTTKWPDLRGWIAARHARGQKVLLWWKAWDPEGLPADLCVRNHAGAPVALDPSNPATHEALRASVRSMLSPEGLDGDGLKIDFTARTPSGRALQHHGPAWGIALLHELLAVVAAAAKEAKPDALLLTQTPHPAFVDVADMIRLNDMIGGFASVVPQMTFRADVTQAALPDLLVDTDDWRIPSREAWREYLAVKHELGVPSLYYATHVDMTGELLESDDYKALREAWKRWEAVRP